MMTAMLDTIDPSAPMVGCDNDLILVPLRSARGGTGYAVFEIVALPGAGLLPLSHADQEVAFYVLEGEWTFQRAGDMQLLGVNEGLFVRRDTVHAFENTGGALGRLLVITSSSDAVDRVIPGRPVTHIDLAG